jgi:PAS domain S-box-containing protein
MTSDPRYQQLESIANVAPALVWITDASKSCTFVNERWLEFSGRTLEQEIGFGWLDEMHADDIARCMPIFENNFAARLPVEIESRQRRHDGVFRWMLSRGVPRFADDGSFAGYIGFAFDVDDMRAAQREKERLAAEVQRERERLLDIISSVPGVVWEAWGEPDQASQRVNFVSDHLTSMLGYTVEEWLSEPNFGLKIIHPDDRESTTKRARAHFYAGGQDVNVFRLMAKDGRAVWCESRSTVVHDESGRPIGMRGVMFDITARKHAEESLRFLAEASEALTSSLDYEETLKATVRLSVPILADWCVVAVVEENGEPRRVAVAHADPAKDALAQRLLNVPRRKDMPAKLVSDHAGGRPFVMNFDDELLRATTYDDAHAALARELGIATMLVVPITVREKNIGTMSFVSATPGRYDEPAVDLAWLLARRVGTAIDNAQLYRAAVAASAAKDEFLATVSHELRTPMTATLGWTRMLRFGHVDEETQKTALEAIERATHAQARLIDDILDVSSIVLGKFRFESLPVDLRAVVDAVVQTAEPALAGKGMAIDVDTARWSGIVQGDASRLQQVLWNLISNSIKFGKRGGRITVTLERAEGSARITVADDGAGIDAEFLPHVFDRFRQADSGATRKHGGLGLGLAIVRHLVELHGGSVRAASDGSGHGAAFVIELPVTTGGGSDVDIEQAVLPDLADMRILVVDDERPTLELLSMVLRRCGASVSLALSAEEALLALNQARHDAIVTDIAMPGSDGNELLARLRARDDANASIPAIALTARSQTPRGDFDRLLRKPIDPVQFAQEVRSVIRPR